MAELTTARRRALEALADVESGVGLPSREWAKRMWPDSPAWDRRTRKQGGGDPGALGGAMPMKAAAFGYRLHRDGLVWRPESTVHPHWYLSPAGRLALEGKP